MKQSAQLLLVILIAFNHAYGQQAKKLLEINNFGSNPGNLKMFVYNNLPKRTSKVPLVVVLHGCGESANSAAELTGWNKLAELNDFVVLYPQQKLLNNLNLCFNWFNLHDIEKGQGECGSIFEMIAFARKHYAIDSSRIFITGLSAGAAMSVVMAATHPELIKGAAVFAGGAYKIATNPLDGIQAMLGKKNIATEDLMSSVREQNPKYNGQYPYLIIYQGLNDPIVHHKNADLILHQWTGVNRADNIADKVERAYNGIEDISRAEYADTSGRTVVTFYEVNNLGHRLMVKPGEKVDEGGKTGMFGVNKGFHSTYQTAKDFELIKKD